MVRVVNFFQRYSKIVKKKYNIEVRHVEIGGHHMLGCVDRFIRTRREMIEKYMLMHNATKHTDALDDLAYNYNNSVNRGIKLKPNEVKFNDPIII